MDLNTSVSYRLIYFYQSVKFRINLETFRERLKSMVRDIDPVEKLRFFSSKLLSEHALGLCSDLKPFVRGQVDSHIEKDR